MRRSYNSPVEPLPNLGKQHGLASPSRVQWTDRFGFPKTNVNILLDQQASKSAIMKALLRQADTVTANRDDRGLVFFAGHGHTARGCRGEIEYLVPVDGDCDDLSSLIRWDDLTRNADLLPAKHVLFVMDACYGGLAVTRRSEAGR